MFTMRSNQALVVYFISSAENGLFAVAVKFVEAWYFVPYALSAIVFPKIIEAQSISSEQFKRILQWAVEIFLIIAIAICVVTFLLAGPTITVFFGNYYEAAETHLKIMIFSTIFVFWGIILEPYEIAKKNPNSPLKTCSDWRHFEHAIKRNFDKIFWYQRSINRTIAVACIHLFYK